MNDSEIAFTSQTCETYRFPYILHHHIQFFHIVTVRIEKSLPQRVGQYRIIAKQTLIIQNNRISKLIAVFGRPLSHHTLIELNYSTFDVMKHAFHQIVANVATIFLSAITFAHATGHQHPHVQFGYQKP